MVDAFVQMASLWQSLAAALLIGVSCAVLGVFCILRRAVFISIALAEVATLGVAAGMLFGLPPLACAALFSASTGFALAPPYESGRLPRDAVLGVIFAIAAAVSILLVSSSALDLHDVKGLIYGDLLLAGDGDVIGLAVFLLPLLALFAVSFRAVLYSFVDRDMARVLGIHVARWESLYFIVLALAIAVATRLAGAMLVFAYVLLPAATALLISRRISRVMFLAPLIAVIGSILGLFLAFYHDWPTNPAITVACSILLALGWIYSRFKPFSG